jgi:hypothetical protein
MVARIIGFDLSSIGEQGDQVKKSGVASTRRKFLASADALAAASLTLRRMCRHGSSEATLSECMKGQANL